MAFFKFRVNHQDDLNSSAPQAQSMEVLRQRVRHRLIGSAILVLIAVIGFPLIFDTQPRPVALDIAIDIPDKARVGVQTPPTPLKSTSPVKAPVMEEAIPSEPPIKEMSHAANPAPSEALGNKAPAALSPSPVASPQVTPVVEPPAQSASGSSHPKESSAGAASKAPKSSDKVESASAKAGLDPKEVIVSSSTNSGAASSAQVESKKEKDAATKESLVAKDTKDAKDSKDKKEAEKPKSDSARFVIQVGAFAEDQKVKDIREKLEKANLHTFTQVVTVKEVKKTRIRLGPFTSKDEANRTLAKVHSLGYNPSLITLP